MITFFPSGQYRRYPHPLLLLQNSFRLAVRVGLILVVTMLSRSPHLHLVAKVPRFYNVAVAQLHGAATPPAGIAGAQLVGLVGAHDMQVGIVGKSKLDAGKH